jgi:hypothetical protein
LLPVADSAAATHNAQLAATNEGATLWRKSKAVPQNES